MYRNVTFQLAAVYRRHCTASPARRHTRAVVLPCLPAVSSQPSPGPPTHCNPLQCLPAVSSLPSPSPPTHCNQLQCCSAYRQFLADHLLVAPPTVTHCNPLQCLPAVSSRPSPGPPTRCNPLQHPITLYLQDSLRCATSYTRA